MLEGHAEGRGRQVMVSKDVHELMLGILSTLLCRHSYVSGFMRCLGPH